MKPNGEFTPPEGHSNNISVPCFQPGDLVADRWNSTTRIGLVVAAGKNWTELPWFRFYVVWSDGRLRIHLTNDLMRADQCSRSKA